MADSFDPRPRVGPVMPRWPWLHRRAGLSLGQGLAMLWVSIAVVALTLAWTVWSLSRQGAEALVRTAVVRVGAACAEMVAAQARAAQLSVADAPAAMEAAIDLALRDMPGVEGGLWQRGRGVVAYAFPTYDGSGIKRDVPEAERERIEVLAARAHAAAQALTEVRPGLRETVVLHACPDRAPQPTMVGWTLQRVPTVAAEALEHLTFALGLLLGFVVLSGGWLGWTLTRWGRGLQTLERALSTPPPAAPQPWVPPTGVPELDRLGAALNDHAVRAQRAREQAERLSAELAQAARLAALGRLSAGLAHEIRNPLATMRLKAENALSAPAPLERERARGALQAVLEQSARIASLVDSLLTLTQPFRVQPEPVVLQDWLPAQLHRHAEAAQQRGVSLTCRLEPPWDGATAPPVWIDPAALSRALDNLLLNALAHTPAGGHVVLQARGESAWLHLCVRDDGPGVPADLLPHLFEPFATGRAGGTGLGLALVREIAQAHGGRVTHQPVQPHGACFCIELPWRAS